MLYKLLTIVMILGFIGCEGKKYEKSENSSISIIDELNNNKADEVIQNLSTRNRITPRERYYLASAFSQKGGVDVFSLYSILEMQLFRKNVLEWSDLSKEKNPYLKFVKAQKGIDVEALLESRKAKWEKFLPKIREKYGFGTEKPLREDWMSVTEEEFNQIDAQYEEIKKKVMALSGSFDEKMESWYDMQESLMEENPKAAYLWDLSGHYYDQIRLENMKENFLYPEKKSSVFGNVQWEMVYMNVLWNTYEAIPLMKEMPNLSLEQQEQVSLALNEYSQLLKDPEFNELAIKNIVVLAGISMLSIYKSSLELENISSIKDLLCSFEPQGLTENYKLLRERILFLAEVISESETLPEVDEYKNDIQVLKDALPASLTAEEKDSFIESAEDFKVDSCFNID